MNDEQDEGESNAMLANIVNKYNELGVEDFEVYSPTEMEKIIHFMEAPHHRYR